MIKVILVILAIILLIAVVMYVSIKICQAGAAADKKMEEYFNEKENVHIG